MYRVGRIIPLLLIASAHAASATRTLTFWGLHPSLDESFAQARDQVIQVRDAAENAGDFSEVEFDSEIIEELDISADRVASATLSAYDDYGGATSEKLTRLDYAEEELEQLIERAQEVASMSIYARMDPTVFASAVGTVSPNDVASAIGVSINLTRTSVRTHLDALLQDSPFTIGVFELGLLLIPVLCIGVAFVILRRARSGEIDLRSEVLLFAHIYWAGYYSVLAITHAIFYKEPPLVVFAHACPREYTVFQVMVFALYLSYTSLILRHYFLERSKFAAAQLGGALGVLIASYVVIVYPAMIASLPPTCGAGAYAGFALFFAVFTGLIREERKGKKE